MNIVMLIGNVVHDIELRYTQNGLGVAKFTLAVNRDSKNKEGNYDTDYLNCISYGKQAEILKEYLTKGSTIAIEGKIQTGSFEKDGKKVYTTDIIVNKTKFINLKTGKPQQELTDTETIQKAMSNDPYESMSQQVEADFETPF